MILTTPTIMIRYQATFKEKFSKLTFLRPRKICKKCDQQLVFKIEDNKKFGDKIG